jgi:hypothetical protein
VALRRMAWRVAGVSDYCRGPDPAWRGSGKQLEPVVRRARRRAEVHFRQVAPGEEFKGRLGQLPRARGR